MIFVWISLSTYFSIGLIVMAAFLALSADVPICERSTTSVGVLFLWPLVLLA